MFINLVLVLALLALAFAEKTKGVPTIYWKSVAIDASGKYHAAAAAYNNDWDQGYPIYLSDDYGATWRQSKSPAVDWRNIYSDSTGQIIVGYAVYNSFSSSYAPPLYISKDRGNTWETGASSSSYAFNNDFIGSNSALWSVVYSQLYYSGDLGKTWSQSTRIINSKGAYAVIGDASLDSTGKHRYVTCDGALCASHNSGQTYLNYPSILATSVETDPTGQYVFILTDKYVQYSSDYAYTWTTVKDYTIPGAAVPTPTFLKMTTDHQYVYTLEKFSANATTTYLSRFSLATKISSYIFYAPSGTINDVAISDTGNSVIVSSTSGLFYTTSNYGTSTSSWVTHDLS